ncbi:cysteine--tRNA ligase [Patescibacteria group bacterium]
MLKLHNTLSRKKEEFKPINPGKVGMYVCGPTVYDHCHLGHARGYVSMDVLRRYLEYMGNEVRHIMNYTDVGHMIHDAETGIDKIEQKAKKEKIDPMEVADKYIQSCQEDFEALNIKKANFNPRPTKYVVQIIKFVQSLIEKGYAYEANGSVYFSVEKFPDYGKLSGRQKDEQKIGARVEINKEKKDPIDFALWIKAPADHILKWESPWGIGYPGWHIECSVMSADLLGQDTFDIHGGGNENVFPHNENEVTQSEAYLGKAMAHIWTHWNMVNVDGEKMSKSKNNFVTIKDALAKYDSAVIRLWILSSHYRSILDFSENSLNQAKENLKRITDFVSNLNTDFLSTAEDGNTDLNTDFDTANYKNVFEEAMNDDLNTPLALSVLYKLIGETNKLIGENKLGKGAARKILSLWKNMNKVFGLKIEISEMKIPDEIRKLADDREEARTSKDFKKADKLRDEIEKKGYILEDTTSGPKCKCK